MLLPTLFIYSFSSRGLSGWWPTGHVGVAQLWRAFREVRAAMNKERHDCTGRRDGEPAVSSH